MSSYIGRSSDGFGLLRKYRWVASGNEASIAPTLADSNGKLLRFTDKNLVHLFLNGVKLDQTDFNLNTANTISGLSALATSDVLEAHVYDVFSIATTDTVSATDGGTFSGAITANSTLDMNGTELILDADADTSITADTDDKIQVKIGGTDKIKIDGTGSETTIFHIGDSTPLSFGTGYNEAVLSVGEHFGIYSDNNGSVNTSEMMINSYNDGSNRVYANTGRHAQRVQFDTYNGNMHFSVSDATGNADANVTFINALSIQNSSANISIGGSIISSSRLSVSSSGTDGRIMALHSSGTGATDAILIQNDNGEVGTVRTSGSSTAYNTSSDYRLKENVNYSWDATTRLKQLKPARFNFKADADLTLDGFLAHEVSSIVPEAISGEKDATQDLGTIKDIDGNVIEENVVETRKGEGQTWTKTKTKNVYQGIDQSKLVPLLVKTIQELEARVTALENA